MSSLYHVPPLKRLSILVSWILTLFFPLLSYSYPVAQLSVAPYGLTNQSNPVIVVGGNDVVAYKYKLDGAQYTEEIPISEQIHFSSDITINEMSFLAGDRYLQTYLDGRGNYINSLVFSNIQVDTPIVFLLNTLRVKLADSNTLDISGVNIDHLDVHMNNSPTVPAVLMNQSLSGGNGTISYRLTTDAPLTDFIRIANRGPHTATLRINLNNMLSSTDSDVLSAIQAMNGQYANEPLERTVWRFIWNNSYEWYGLSYFSEHCYPWETASPALFFNSIGFGLCYNFADLYCLLASSFGFPTRMIIFDAHAVAEAYADGKWMLYDPYLKVYYYNYTGEVAGIDELVAHPDLITNPINPILDPSDFAYSQSVADIYSTPVRIYPYEYNLYHDSLAYLLEFQIPSGGILDFPAIFAAPIHTLAYSEAPFYTNARLTVPRNWSGTLNTPLVIHSIGYDGSHELSVIGRDGAGNWQQVPTATTWTADTWAPLTVAHQSNATDPVTLSSNEPAAIYYTTDGSTPTTESPRYSTSISMASSPVLKFFGVDIAGNREGVKCYSPATGAMYAEPVLSPPVEDMTFTVDKPSPQTPGATITFKAAAMGGSGAYEYTFVLVNNKTGQWSYRSFYSINASWTWNTTAFETGMYIIYVLVRNVGSSVPFDVSKNMSYRINPPDVLGPLLRILLLE